jgi:RNA polymerase sigma factor (sigma-70 family)
MYLMTGDRAEAEDLAQEAMSRVFERWHRVAGMDSPAGYAYRVAVNLHRRHFRRAEPSAELRASAGPEELVESRDEVLRVLASLSLEQREALVLVEWLGLDAEEAGRVLGIDAASVRGRIHRARVALRDRLGVRDE